MAKKPQAAPEPGAAQSVVPDAQYRVKIKKVVTAAGVRFKPRHGYIVKGRVVEQLGDAISSIEKV